MTAPTNDHAPADHYDEHAAALHYEAVRIVRRMAGLPEIDPEESRRRALERESRWSA